MDKIQLTYKMKLRNIDKKTYKTLQYITKLSKNLYNEAIYLERSAYQELSNLNKDIEKPLRNKDMVQILLDIVLPNSPPRELTDVQRIYLAWKYKLSNFPDDKMNEPFSSFVNSNILDKVVLSSNYFLLHSANSQAILQQVEKNYLSYFKINKIKSKKPPYYLSKDGHFQLTFKNISKRKVQDGIFKVPFSRDFKKYVCKKRLLTDIQIELPDKFKDTDKYQINQIKIIPKSNARYFELCIIYTTSCNKIEDLDKNQYLGIDLGLIT